MKVVRINMREWIVTNGLGGYASLNYQNNNSRKFHGLLVSSLNPPVERWVFVSNVIDEIQIDDKKFDLREQKGKFISDIFPTFSYDFNGVNIQKTIFMEYGKNTTVLKYKVKTDREIKILHNPIINSRHFYDVNKQRYLTFRQDTISNGVAIKPENINKTLKIILNNSSYTPLQYWEEFYYEKDKLRNESWIDNNVHIGRFIKDVKNSDEYYIVLSIEDKINPNISKIWSTEVKRKKDLLKKANLPKKFEKLIISSDKFIVKKGSGKSIIAGYHWFADWGRDTLISLPGLCLVTKRFDEAKDILLGLSKYCKNGLIPNAFMDRDSKAIYNTVDASLWYIDRVYQYLKYTNDKEFLNKIWKTMQSIMLGYIKGTDYGIKMDEDFLIGHDPGLTWMDVKIGDYYPTPRSRKAVEIQALWYNALKIMSILSQMQNKTEKFLDVSEKVKESFNYKFDGLYDVIDLKDTSLRPNIIFLASLDYTMIDNTLQEKIINDVRDKLLTIFGLRTLSPDNEKYMISYIGDFNKEEAYHNGTVWPWLLGQFIKAYVKVKKHAPVFREFAYKNYIQPMFDVFDDQWDGSIYEIFDGDPIYTPRGCISQAWSVAEILRSWVEDIENIKPKYEEIFVSPKISV
jgi:predicted glycogen debranching enzyme